MIKSKVKTEVNQTPLVVSEHMGNGTLMLSVNRGRLYKPNRSGNYSGRGYSHMDGPLTEAERWDMPFVNPVFEYETYTEG